MWTHSRVVLRSLKHQRDRRGWIWESMHRRALTEWCSDRDRRSMGFQCLWLFTHHDLRPAVNERSVRSVLFRLFFCFVQVINYLQRCCRPIPSSPASYVLSFFIALIFGKAFCNGGRFGSRLCLTAVMILGTRFPLMKNCHNLQVSHPQDRKKQL